MSRKDDLDKIWNRKNPKIIPNKQEKTKIMSLFQEPNFILSFFNK
jgi:hypothetical protein